MVYFAPSPVHTLTSVSANTDVSVWTGLGVKWNLPLMMPLYMLHKWEIIVSGMRLWMIMWDNCIAEIYGMMYKMATVGPALGHMKRLWMVARCSSRPKAVGCSSAPEVKIRLVNRCVLPILSHTECCPAPALLWNGGKLLPKASLLPCATLM